MKETEKSNSVSEQKARIRQRYVIVNKKFPKMAEKIPHFIYLGKGTAIDAFPSFYLSF